MACRSCELAQTSLEKTSLDVLRCQLQRATRRDGRLIAPTQTPETIRARGVSVSVLAQLSARENRVDELQTFGGP